MASDHVTHLKNDKLSAYQYLFVAAMLNRLSEKYNFNREINDSRISREKIFLPVDESGNPCWLLIENYMRDAVLRNTKSMYLSIIKHRTNARVQIP